MFESVLPKIRVEFTIPKERLDAFVFPSVLLCIRIDGTIPYVKFEALKFPSAFPARIPTTFDTLMLLRVFPLITLAGTTPINRFDAFIFEIPDPFDIKVVPAGNWVVPSDPNVH